MAADMKRSAKEKWDVRNVEVKNPGSTSESVIERRKVMIGTPLKASIRHRMAWTRCKNFKF